MGKGVVGEGGKVSGSSAQSNHRKAVEDGDHCRNNNYGRGDLASAKQLVLIAVSTAVWIVYIQHTFTPSYTYTGTLPSFATTSESTSKPRPYVEDLLLIEISDEKTFCLPFKL